MAAMSTISPTYRFVMAASTPAVKWWGRLGGSGLEHPPPPGTCGPPRPPAVKWWGRLEVSGLEHLPAEGPVLLAGNHDSYWDPIAIGIAGLPRRQICALAKSSLWKPGLAKILDGMGQIPMQRGRGRAARTR